jgi:hypothetical protein
MFKRLFILMVLFFSACAPAATDVEDARGALYAFFNSLNKGQYAEAVALYGGEYTVLADDNPELDPSDHTALWKNACTINGFQCLSVRTAIVKEMNTDEYVFIVEFNTADGDLFIWDPECDEINVDVPPFSLFEYQVKKNADGEYVVLDLPVYVP